MGDATIICLAKSRKDRKYCIAGRRFDGVSIGAWIRPVTDRDGGAVAGSQALCVDGTQAEVADILTIPLCGPCPIDHQVENHQLDVRRRWDRLGSASWTILWMAQDLVDESFWQRFEDSHYGIGDRVPVAVASSADGSLRLVYTKSLRLTMQREPSVRNPLRRTVRAEFEVNGVSLRLLVTDPRVESFSLGLFERGRRMLDLGMAMVCVSLSRAYLEYAYRLAAAIITPSYCESRKLLR